MKAKKHTARDKRIYKRGKMEKMLVALPDKTFMLVNVRHVTFH